MLTLDLSFDFIFAHSLQVLVIEDLPQEARLMIIQPFQLLLQTMLFTLFNTCHELYMLELSHELLALVGDFLTLTHYFVYFVPHFVGMLLPLHYFFGQSR